MHLIKYKITGVVFVPWVSFLRFLATLVALRYEKLYSPRQSFRIERALEYSSYLTQIKQIWHVTYKYTLRYFLIFPYLPLQSQSQLLCNLIFSLIVKLIKIY